MKRMSLREWKCDIPILQQYVQLHRPEQPSITYLTLALSFSMRLTFVLNAPIQLESGGYLLALLRDSLLSSSLLIGWEFSSRWSDVLGSQRLGFGWGYGVVAGRSFEAVTDSSWDFELVISSVERMWWPSLWPSVLITCPKFDDLLPVLDLLISILLT